VISPHLPALQVAIPLLAAPFCVLIRQARMAWALALGVSAAALFIAAGLLQEVTTNGTLSYALGGWVAPWGIEYRVDSVNALVLVIVSGISTVTLLFARDSIEQEIRRHQVYLLYTSWLLCLTGLLGMAVTGDAFNLFVFLEISSLSSYVLVAMGKGRKPLLAAFRYLILGTLGATFILIGVGLLYVLTGTLNMADLATRLDAVQDTHTIAVAFGFLTVGIGIKAAIFPLHFWLPDAYTSAPSAVTAFLAGSTTKVSVYVLVRFFFTILGPDFSFQEMLLQHVLLPVAVLAVLMMSTVAVFQNDIKYMLAYSSVAQIGYMVLGISLVSTTGLTASLLHLFNHALIKTALFLALGALTYRIGAVTRSSIAGLGRQMPLTMAAFTVAGLSLVGVPLTVGFVSKWYLILAALERGWWPLAVVVLVGSLLALVYVWRVIEIAYMRQPAEAARVAEVSPWLWAPIWLLVGANVYFGIDTSLTTTTATQAAQVLMGGSP